VSVPAAWDEVTSVFVTVGRPYVTVVDHQGVLHAVPWTDPAAVPLCGIEEEVAATSAIRVTDGNPIDVRVGALLLSWPPYATGPDGYTRCRACWEQSGKPRPADQWREKRRAG